MSLVIIGGGMAGTTLALKLLAKKREFILINPADYFHLNFAAVRAVAVKGWADKSLIPLAPVFGESFKQGKVVKIEPGDPEGKVILESGEEIQYRHLVIATGTTHKWPVKLTGLPKDDAINDYNELIDRVEKAKTIVVAGGGATGVETVAELKTFYPDKEVVLIHSSNALLTPKLSERSQQFLQNQLQNDFHVQLVLGERVENLAELPETGPGTVLTDKGTSFEADVVFKFIGLQLSTDAYKDSLGSAMTDKGALKVDNSFHVEGFPNIYALGDCTNFDEPKIGALAINHGEIMAKSVLNLDKGKKEAVYKPDGFFLEAVVSLGPNSAYGRSKKDWKMPVFLLKKVKSTHLFSDKWWKDMKQQRP